LLDAWRKVLRTHGEDPFGKAVSDDIGRKALDNLLCEGDPEAAGVLHTAIEEFAQRLASVISRFVTLNDWKNIERLVIGGGFRESRIGELAIGRASVLLKAGGTEVKIAPVRHSPDEAGMIGVIHLVPSWMFKGFDAVLGADIGGTNIRAGLVALNLKRARDLSKAEVAKYESWRHADEKPKRDEAVARLAKKFAKLVAFGEKEGVKIAPFIGVGCPGKIKVDGRIDRGAQNLPGNWARKGFNLPAALREAFPRIGKHQATVLLHNDAVVQRLSEVPFMGDVERWAILTIGTGFGNASFANRKRGD
jgi:predicted NBD/HSP70 family sugar kinase